MYVKSLKLRNFRLYDNYAIEFEPGVNIILGDNATGKTSIVEAVYSLGLGKSFKAGSDKEMIKANTQFTSIKGLFLPNNDEITLIINDSGKTLKKNNYKYKLLSEHLSFVNVIIFTPDDIQLIKGGPIERRKFMDINFAQINKRYLQSLINYKRSLKQRNELLKSFGSSKDIDYMLLDAITDTLIQDAKVIVTERSKYIDQMKPFIDRNIDILSSGNETMRIVYKPSCNVDKMWKTFKEKVNYDLHLQTTTVGPHRDDFLMYINDQEVSVYGSQGQQRSASLVLQMSLANLMYEFNPSQIVILDDVFSELDIYRQNKVFSLIENQIQMFITTTSIESISQDVLKSCNVININKKGV